MAEINVIRHEIWPHKPFREEEYDPSQDMLVVVHRNPNDPDDPVEFGHHLRLHGISYRKEMWGLTDYASTIDMELRDLERYYDRPSPDTDYGIHPLASITEHYFDAPPARMRTFAPDYVMDKVEAELTALPHTTDGAVKMCLDTVASGIVDVKSCLASDRKQSFPCKGMTNLSGDTVVKRADSSLRMEQQTQRLTLVSSGPLDAVRQALTDRESELEMARDAFVDQALLQSHVPEIMRKRVVAAAVRRGVLEESTWM